MSEWITDRLPTAADADGMGEVRVRRSPDRAPGASMTWAHYSVITPGQPWWSPKAERAAGPAPAPAPAPVPARVVTALTFDPDNVIIAACNDGTLWAKDLGGEWYQLPSIPQPEAPDA